MTKKTMFRARDCTYQDSLVRLEVDRSTDSSVWINGRRVARKSAGTLIEDSFSSVKYWIVTRLKGQIAVAEDRLAKMRRRLAEVEATEEADIKLDNSLY